MGGGPGATPAGVTVSFWPDAYAEHAPGLRSFLRRRVRSTEQAEDLTHETFVRAFGARDGLRDPERIRPYLYRTAWRLLLNQRRRPELARCESDLGDGAELAELARDDRASSDDAVRERELREAVGRALAALPPDQARAFTWAVLEQRSYAEIAAHTGWSRAKVKISVFRARQRVMDELERCGLTPPREDGSR